MSAKTSELTQLGCLLVLIALFYTVLVPLGVLDPEGMGIDEGLPPSFSPRLLAFVAALIIIGRMIRLLVLPDASPSASELTSQVISDPVVFTHRVLLGIGAALIYALVLMPFAGFVIASVILLFVMLAILGEREKIRLVLFPCLVTLGVWLLFVQLLSVQLPVGTLFDT